MAHALPDGYTARPATVDDAERVADLFNDRSEVTLNERPTTSDRVLKRWDHPKFDLSTDSRLVFGPDGELIGYAHIRDVKDPPVDVFTGYTVHPDYDDARWLWDNLFGWMESEARRVIPKAPADALIALIAGTSDSDPVEQRELERHDFAHNRTFHRMSVDFEGTVSPPVLPAGVTIRTFEPGVDDEAVVAAYREAFANHYGHLDQPFEADLAEWRHWMTEDDFEADLWFLACDGEELAGFCTCYAQAPGEPDRGLIDELGVRPAWRRQGIGRALLLHAFGVLAVRGVEGAVLSVDTENRLGAPALYEGVGMRSIRASHTYVKELRPGINLVVQ